MCNATGEIDIALVILAGNISSYFVSCGVSFQDTTSKIHNSKARDSPVQM
jgi:hypothetical protein